MQVSNFIAYCFQTFFFQGLQLIQCRLQLFKLLCRLFSFFRVASLQLLNGIFYRILRFLTDILRVIMQVSNFIAYCFQTLFFRGLQLIQCRLQLFKLLCHLLSFFRAASLQFCLLTVQLSADILCCVIQHPAKFFNISALVVFLIIQRPYDIFCRFLCFLTGIFRGSVQVGDFTAHGS